MTILITDAGVCGSLANIREVCQEGTANTAAQLISVCRRPDVKPLALKNKGIVRVIMCQRIP